MRIRTATGLALAGAAAAGVLAIGGVAFAGGLGDADNGEPVVRIITTEDQAHRSGSTDGTSTVSSERDCPGKQQGSTTGDAAGSALAGL